MTINPLHTQARAEYDATRGTSAFNIKGAKGKKLNQYATRYTFADGSILTVYPHGNRINFQAYEGAPIFAERLLFHPQLIPPKTRA